MINACAPFGLPFGCSGASTDSHSADARAGYESMHGFLTTLNCGIDFVLHAAVILSSFLALSCENPVHEHEMYSMTRRYRQGSSDAPEMLAHAVISNVFISLPVTRKRESGAEPRRQKPIVKYSRSKRLCEEVK
jgi:trimethylamine:corrinoid methyltransferase-like protein